MRELTPSAGKRLNALERDTAEQFDQIIIHNRVWEAIREDDRLRHVLDVTERAYELDERDDLPDEMDMVPFGAAEDLNDHIDTLVDMAVARECAAVIDDARGDWFDDSDHLDQRDVEAAFHEACAWLGEHSEAAEAEGIDVDDVIWGDGHEADDPEVTADV